MLNKPYLSIQEMVEKTQTQRKQIKEQLDATTTYHPDDASLTAGLNAEDTYMVQHTLQTVPLREFLAKSGTTGIGGAAYLVPAAVHDRLTSYVGNTDLCPLISAQMVEGWKGSNLIVDIMDNDAGKMRAWEFSSGGSLPTETVDVAAQATLTPKGFGIAPRIGADLIEDQAFDLIDFHLQKAAEAIGEKASELAVTVLGTATDGVGTVNSGNAGADTTTWANLETARAANTDDRFISNTVLINPEAWEDAVRTGVGAETAGGAAGDYWQPYADTHICNGQPVAPGFDFRIGTLDFKLWIGEYNHAAYPTDTTSMTNCITFIFDRNNALLTGRKRWMEMKNYADPVKDLDAMVISCRQDSVTLYNDSIYKLSET